MEKVNDTQFIPTDLNWVSPSHLNTLLLNEYLNLISSSMCFSLKLLLYNVRNKTRLYIMNMYKNIYKHIKTYE